jgi:hypothetical protein
MGPEMVVEMASRLASELVTLHAKVASRPYFHPPSVYSRAVINRYLPQILEVTAQSQNSPLNIPRNSRAVSLPPNPELIHSRPSPEPGETRDEKTSPVPDGQPPPILQMADDESCIAPERRTLGEGIPQFQPYW